eukprot:TRINITY_DN8562_c0_g1_i1.p1 TRINITY_DN8562_c0_g1~~TRINITY_DN8562_c0_g1_i1.p1  ORF type:complete len:188 (+),score=24.45 TRINITY_DN8562_c0_g1_i1:142-705(+)
MNKNKVHPPRLNGTSKGVFATRSPHRPNSIGLSVGRLEKIERDVIHLSGLDLVHGTPVFDIKPYIPEFDGIPPDCRSAKWIEEARPPQLPIRFSAEAEHQLEELISKRIPQFYSTVPELKAVIVQIIEHEPRSVHVKGVHEKHGGGEYGFCIDVLNVNCRYTPSEVEISSLEDWSSRYEPHTEPKVP